MTAPLSLSTALGNALADKRIDILRQIGAGGSISQAARAVGVSYKAAWQAVDTLTNLAGTPLVVRAVGGAGGGGAQLTDAGRELLAAADAMAQARGAVLSRWQAASQTGAALGYLAVRTSMRNQWPCVVQQLHVQGPIVRVSLALQTQVLAAGGDPARAPTVLASRITQESAQLLGLQAGTTVQALCKATAVRVQRAVVQSDARRSRAGDVFGFSAKAVRVSRGDGGDEVSAFLDAGVQMVGFAPAGSGLRAGSRVQLWVDDSAVVLALGGQ